MVHFVKRLSNTHTYTFFLFNFVKPHDVDPSMFKSKKQKTDNENQSTAPTPTINSPATSILLNSSQELNKTPQNQNKKRYGSKSPATVITAQPQLNTQPPTSMVSNI